MINIVPSAITLTMNGSGGVLLAMMNGKQTPTYWNIESDFPRIAPLRSGLK
jgi:hypothetical protein